MLIAVTILAWFLFLTPLILFLGLSIHMLRGIMEDDATIKALTMLGIALCAIGGILLLLIYMTDILPSIAS
jgi:xanthine/uracil permease